MYGYHLSYSLTIKITYNLFMKKNCYFRKNSNIGEVFKIQIGIVDLKKIRLKNMFLYTQELQIKD